MARFSNGWVKIHRKALLGDIGASYIRSGLFGTLVAIANLQESTAVWNGKPRKIQRGELVTSLKELAELGDVDEKTVNRHLNYLVLRGTIILEKSRTGTFIKFLNFEQYQSKDAEGSVQGPFGVDDNMEDEVRSSGIHIEEYNNKEGKNTNGPVAAKPKPTKSPRETFEFDCGEELQKFFSQKTLSVWLKLYNQEYINREFIKMTAWFIANPGETKKTHRGWSRFVSGWLDRGWAAFQKAQSSPTQGKPGVFIPQANPAHFNKGVA